MISLINKVCLSLRVRMVRVLYFFFSNFLDIIIFKFEQGLRSKRAYHLSKKGSHYSNTKRERLGLIELATIYAC